MKLNHLFPSLLLCCLVAAGCSENNTVEPENPVSGETAYVSVNIVSPSSSSRALSGFEVGTDAENDVNESIFFFFDAGENSCVDPVQPTLLFNDNAAGGTTNVESISEAMVVLTNPTAIPTSVVVILNPTEAIKGLGRVSLKTLQAAAEAYSLVAPFTMSNSSYMNEYTKEPIQATTLSGNQIRKTIAEAKANPVNIPVERVVAKVSVEKGSVVGAETVNINGTDTPVTIALLGWKITNTLPQSKLLKEIDNTWTIAGWNDEANQRSYWAKSYELASGESYGYHTYATIAANTDPEYCFENTTVADPTKIIVAAELRDANGSPIDLMEWNGVKYTKSDLVGYILGTSSIQQYYIDDPVTSGKYITIPAAGITFTTTGTKPNNRYQVLPTLTAEYASKTFYTMSGTVSAPIATPVPVATVNEQLALFGQISSWNEGGAYYYADIEHMGGTDLTAEGAIGVIRNHFYKLVISSVVGLGTPVPDKTVTIIPEPKIDENSYLAATVTILSWKTVTQSVDLK